LTPCADIYREIRVGLQVDNYCTAQKAGGDQQQDTPWTIGSHRNYCSPHACVLLAAAGSDWCPPARCDVGVYSDVDLSSTSPEVHYTEAVGIARVTEQPKLLQPVLQHKQRLCRLKVYAEQAATAIVAIARRNRFIVFARWRQYVI